MTNIDNLHLILLNAGFSSHNGDWNWKGISSPFARIYYVKEGNARIIFPTYQQELKSNHLYIIPPFTLHSYECDTFFSHYYIHIYEKEFSYNKYLEDLIFPSEIKANKLDLELVERLVKINPERALRQFDPKLYDNTSILLKSIAEETQQPNYKALETKGILLQLFSCFLKDAANKTDISDKRIAQAVRYIRKNTDKPIRINELAELCNLSEDHFIRLFKREMNCSTIHYINQKKIEKAQVMLLTHKQPIKDIAYALSFENISYFNRVFKQITHHTPTEYCDYLREEVLGE